MTIEAFARYSGSFFLAFYCVLECSPLGAYQVVLVVKNPLASAGDERDTDLILGSIRCTPVANHSSILAWRIPWTEEPGGLSSIGLQRVGHN